MVTVLLAIAVALPLAMAAGASWLWSASLPRPWMFFGISVVALYILMGYLLVRIFSRIGIAGVPSAEAKPLFGVGESEVLLALAIVLVAGSLAMWVLRFFLRRV